MMMMMMTIMLGKATMWGRQGLIWITLLSTMISLAAGLRCYECSDMESNEDCNAPSNLVDCNNKSATVAHYDTCMTKISKSAGVETITKKCVVGPCELITDSMNTALGLEECDRSKDEYNCELCCQIHECNVNLAIRTLSTLKIYLIGTALGLLFFFDRRMI